MEKQLINVNGMTCSHCIKAVTDELMELDGVKNVDVSLADNTVNVTFDTDKTSISTIKDLINEIGYEVV